MARLAFKPCLLSTCLVLVSLLYHLSPPRRLMPFSRYRRYHRVGTLAISRWTSPNAPQACSRDQHDGMHPNISAHCNVLSPTIRRVTLALLKRILACTCENVAVLLSLPMQPLLRIALSSSMQVSPQFMCISANTSVKQYVLKMFLSLRCLSSRPSGFSNSLNRHCNG